MAVMAVVIITRGVMAVAVAMVAAAMAVAPGKGSGENLKKSSPQRERGIPSGFPTQEGVQVGVISVPLNTSPT